jgi:hypothetical protein
MTVYDLLLTAWKLYHDIDLRLHSLERGITGPAILFLHQPAGVLQRYTNQDWIFI